MNKDNKILQVMQKRAHQAEEVAWAKAQWCKNSKQYSLFSLNNKIQEQTVEM